MASILGYICVFYTRDTFRRGFFYIDKAVTPEYYVEFCNQTIPHKDFQLKIFAQFKTKNFEEAYNHVCEVFKFKQTDSGYMLNSLDLIVIREICENDVFKIPTGFCLPTCSPSEILAILKETSNQLKEIKYCYGIFRRASFPLSEASFKYQVIKELLSNAHISENDKLYYFVHSHHLINNFMQLENSKSRRIKRVDKIVENFTEKHECHKTCHSRIVCNGKKVSDKELLKLFLANESGSDNEKRVYITQKFGTIKRSLSRKLFYITNDESFSEVRNHFDVFSKWWNENLEFTTDRAEFVNFAQIKPLLYRTSLQPLFYKVNFIACLQLWLNQKNLSFKQTFSFVLNGRNVFKRNIIFNYKLKKKVQNSSFQQSSLSLKHGITLVATYPEIETQKNENETAFDVIRKLREKIPELTFGLVGETSNQPLEKA